VIIKLKVWKDKHPDLYEFILFNIMSNVATVTNFVILWIGSGLLFKAFEKDDFIWFIFDYPKENGGLSGFLAFLLAYISAQTVNFIVQRKVVFGATCKISKVLPCYIITVTVAGIISIWLPPHVISFIKPFVGSYAVTLANVINIGIQVVINYPMLKFVIMRKS
jgi:putative flippase GtrA